MLVGFIALEIFASPLSSIFGLSGETQRICISAMRVISVSFVFAGINIALQGVFQGINSGIPSLIISLLRQFVLVLPVAYSFTIIVKWNYSLDFLIWTTFIIAEVVTSIVAVILFKKENIFSK